MRDEKEKKGFHSKSAKNIMKLPPTVSSDTVEGPCKHDRGYLRMHRGSIV